MVAILWYGVLTGGITEGNQRYYWYAGQGTPDAWFDGTLRILGGASSGSMYSYYYPKVNQRRNVSSPLEMDFSCYMKTANFGELFGTIRVDASMAAGEKRFFLAIVEDPVSTNQRYLARAFFDIQEFTLTNIDDTETIIHPFNLIGLGSASNMKYILFVQNMATKEVLQAVQAEHSSVPPIDVAATAVDSPIGANPIGSYLVSATITNTGGLDQTDIPVACTIYREPKNFVSTLTERKGTAQIEIRPDSGSPGFYQEGTGPVYTGTTTTMDIPAGESVSVDFPTLWQVDTPGKYRITVSTALPDDYVPWNDTVVSYVHIEP